MLTAYPDVHYRRLTDSSACAMGGASGSEGRMCDKIIAAATLAPGVVAVWEGTDDGITCLTGPGPVGCPGCGSRWSLHGTGVTAELVSRLRLALLLAGSFRSVPA